MWGLRGVDFRARVEVGEGRALLSEVECKGCFLGTRSTCWPEVASFAITVSLAIVGCALIHTLVDSLIVAEDVVNDCDLDSTLGCELQDTLCSGIGDPSQPVSPQLHTWSPILLHAGGT